MQSRNLLLMSAIAGLLLSVVNPARGQQSIFHDPFLNWDFINFTAADANDFEIVVATPNWTPPQVYTGFFPTFNTSSDPVSGGTKLSWSGNTVLPGGIAHVGAAMMGSGKILDAYWTKDGQKVGDSIAIVYEKTQVFRFPIGPAAIAMNLQVAPSFQGTAGLANIRTFCDLPADLLGLNDLTGALTQRLNEPPIHNHETIPTELVSLSLVGGEPIIQTRPLQPISVLPSPGLTADSFFDVFVDMSFNANQRFESLLVADVLAFDPASNSWNPIGRFWNLNPQSPEPTSLVLMGLGGLLMLGGRKTKTKK